MVREEIEGDADARWRGESEGETGDGVATGGMTDWTTKSSAESLRLPIDALLTLLSDGCSRLSTGLRDESFRRAGSSMLT
jgi:hypothetical protein